MGVSGVHEGYWDYVVAWFLSLLFAAMVVAGRVAAWLYGTKAPEPPDDPTLFVHWKRRRLWIVISEFSALPAFASLSMGATIWWDLSPFLSIPISMVLAILGFLLLLDGVQQIFRRRLGLQKGDTDA